MEFLRDIEPGEIELAGTIVLLSFVVIFIALERIYPYKKNVKVFRKGFWMDLVWYTLIQSYFLKILIFDIIIAPLKNWFGLGEAGLISHWPIWALVIFFLITHDLYIYWFHRWQHNSKILWRTHEAHHSVKDVDWLAGSRSHALEILINQTIEFLPIFFLLDVKTAAIVVPIKALLDAVWGMWIHSNINVKSGKLQYFINGPEMHQWHHANHKEVFYANYATKFAFWDWMFGTAFLPGLNPPQWAISKPIAYGLPYPYPEDFFTQTIYAIFRFDLKKLRENRAYQFFRDIRKSMLNLPVFSMYSTRLNKIFVDDENPDYKIDWELPNCPACNRPMKYLYNSDQLEWHCDSCDKQLTTDLNKFGI
jgi:sterol desaturase/sphingolipid hydroxylase (fatty acid hydroxylase superfamily)